MASKTELENLNKKWIAQETSRNNQCYGCGNQIGSKGITTTYKQLRFCSIECRDKNYYKNLLVPIIYHQNLDT